MSEVAATHRELGHVFDHRYAVQNPIVRGGSRDFPRRRSSPQFKTGASKNCAYPAGVRSAHHRAGRRQQETNATAHQLSRSRRVRPRLPRAARLHKTSRGGYKSNRKIVDHRFKGRQKPPLRVRQLIGDDDSLKHCGSARARAAMNWHRSIEPAHPRRLTLEAGDGFQDARKAGSLRLASSRRGGGEPSVRLQEQDQRRYGAAVQVERSGTRGGGAAVGVTRRGKRHTA
jgi:hypothetical protein